MTIATPFLAPLAAWVRRRRAQRILSRMDDRLLADIGMARDTIADRLKAAEAEAAERRATDRAGRHGAGAASGARAGAHGHA